MRLSLRWESVLFAQREAALCQKKDPQLRVEVEVGIKPGNAGTDDNHVEILLHSVSPFCKLGFGGRSDSYFISIA